MVVYAAPMVSGPAEVAIANPARGAIAPDRTVAVVLLGTDAGGALTDPRQRPPALPGYDFPEPAVRAIGLAAAHAAWVQRPPVPTELLADRACGVRR